MMDDNRNWPITGLEGAGHRQDDDLEQVVLAGEDRRNDPPTDYRDVPEPLEDDSDSSLGGTTDPEASRNRREGLRKDESDKPDEVPNIRKG